MFRFLQWFKREPQQSALGIPTIKFDKKRVTSEIMRALKADIDGLPVIPTQLRKATYDVALASILRGRDLAFLTSWLVAQEVAGIGIREAAGIAQYLNNRATSRMGHASQRELGIAEGIWMHSGADCIVEFADDHRLANGRKYSLRDGLLIRGVPTWPGMEHGCKCTHRPVIPGFD